MKLFNVLLLFALAGLASCKKFIELQPADKTTSEVTFSNVKNAENAVNGLYANFSTSGLIYSTRLYTDISLLSDELKTSNSGSTPFAENNITPSFSGLLSFWSGHYAVINDANVIIDHLPGVPGISADKLAAWTGEAKLVRAWNYLYLTQLFGKVPKVTSSAWRDNASLGRSSVDDIYAFILQDLKDAEAGLPHDYSDATLTRIRATKAAARALQVKLYMLKKDWTNAELMATAVINDSVTYSLQSSYADVFTANSKESIWELWFGEKTPNGVYNAFVFGARAQYTPSTKMVLAFNASIGDARTAVSISAGKVNKYPSNTARTKLLRLADIYLLRAEARAQLNKTTESASDLNRIRTRANLAATTASTKDDLLLAIENERYLELAFEGQRWFDLVRTGRADAILKVVKPATWQASDVLLPVPQAEISLNPNLLPQNPY